MAVIPLVICDDSNMARKQLVRSLPEGWAVSITQATNGEEALTTLRQGLGQVMLLDLTMPILDGYGTLAAIRNEGLAVKVIVVSGDVQDQAVARVRELGALDFLRKPADPAELAAVLERHGLYSPSPAALPEPVVRPELEVSFRDAFREVVNVSMGRAGALLAKALDVFVQLPIPNVNILEVSELHMTLVDAQREDRLSAVCQGYIGEGIAGEALLIFHDSEFDDMAKLVRWREAGESGDIEMLLDLSSIIIGACLAGIAEQFDIRFSQGHPTILGHHASIDELIVVNKTRWKKTLAVELSYSLEGHNVHFDLLLLFTEDSVKRITRKIGYLMS
ncbi:response regulator [Pseudomonas oryzihabitans]|uniref:response regulator n=1 Tax=Pseudomonas oryzihabitans TaxID=47885 RepID=UPI00128F3F79|nr:response regulator [Pseudomonas psychrotolerans]